MIRKPFHPFNMENQIEHSVRDSRGRYIKGKPGGPGRPPRSRELSNQQIADEVWSDDQSRLVYQQILLDATGRKIVKDEDGKSQVVKDEKSHPKDRAPAQKLFVENKLGLPVRPILVQEDREKTIMEIFETMTNDDLKDFNDELIQQAYEIKVEKERDMRNRQKKRININKSEPEE